MAIKIDPKAGNPWRGKDNKFAASPLPDDDGLKEKMLQALTARREKKAKLEAKLAETSEAELQTQLKAVNRVDALKTQLESATDPKRVQRKINRESLAIRQDLPTNAADLQTAISDRREQEQERKELGKRQYNDLLDGTTPELTPEQETALLQHMNLDRENVNPSDLITPLDSIPHSDLSGLDLYRGTTINPNVRVNQELKDFNYQSFSTNKDVATLYSKAKQLDRENHVPAVIITRTPEGTTGLVPGRFEPSQIAQEEVAIGPGYSLRARTVTRKDDGSLEIHADLTKIANADKPAELLVADSFTLAPKSPLNQQGILATDPIDVEFERTQRARATINELVESNTLDLDDKDVLEKINAIEQEKYARNDSRNVKLVQYTQEDIDTVRNAPSNIQLYDLALEKQLAEDDKLNVNPVGLAVLKEYEKHYTTTQKIRLLQTQWVYAAPEEKEQILQEIGLLRSTLPKGLSLDDVAITLGQLRTKARAANTVKITESSIDPLEVDFTPADESEEEYIPAENVSIENGKNADKDVNDTVYDAPAKTPASDELPLPSIDEHLEESEQTHSISVGAIPEILDGIDTVDVADLGCIMIDTETLPILEYVENGEEDLVFETDAHDHTMGAVAETEAHVTLLFGLLENGNVIKKNVDAALDGWDTPEIKITEVDYFDTSPDHNVIIAKVEKTPELVDGHERLTTLPNRQTFSEYAPHLTLAYIKKDADVQKWVKALGKVYNGKTIAATGLNYGDEPSEAAKGTNPKVIHSIIEIEKKTYSLLNAYEHNGHTHAIDPSLLADVNVLQLQNNIYSADQAYAQRYIKSLEEAEPIPPEEGSLLFEAIVAAIVLYYTVKGLALLKPTVLKLGKELPRSPRITVQDIQPLASEIANLVAESHSETIKNDVASISLKLAAGRKLKEIRDNEAELARFIPEMRRLTSERLTGRSKLVALNEATRAANKLSIFAAEQFEKENNVKIKKRLRSSTGSPCPECAKIIARTAAKPIPLKQSYVKDFKFDKPVGGNIHVSCACYSEFLVNGKIISSFDPILHPRVLSGKRGGQFRKKLGINPSVKVKYAHASPTAFNNYNVPSLFTQKMPQHDEDSVNFFRKRIQRGLPIPPISVQKAEDGSLTIGDGYHRMRAFYLENRQPNIVEVKSKDESYQLTQDWIEQNSWWNIIPKSLQEKPSDAQLLALADNVPSTDQETVFQALYTLLGYNEKPTVLSSNEFDGISGTEWTTARGKAKYYDAFRNDDEHYVSDLPTVYGPGTYFADDTGRASEYAGKDVNTVLAAKLPDDMPLLPADEGFDSQSYTDKRLRELSLIALAMAASASTDEEKDFYKARSEKLKDLRMINRLSLSSTLMGYPGIYVDNDTKNTTVANYLVVNDRGSLLVRADDKEFR